MTTPKETMRLILRTKVGRSPQTVDHTLCEEELSAVLPLAGLAPGPTIAPDDADRLATALTTARVGFGEHLWARYRQLVRFLKDVTTHAASVSHLDDKRTPWNPPPPKDERETSDLEFDVLDYLNPPDNDEDEDEPWADEVERPEPSFLALVRRANAQT
jgi:hypothetical protein